MSPANRILIVGAGFSGAVLGRELARLLDARILLIDVRDHVAGNCYTERDAGTQVMLHRYGPHIFHTSREDVWKYVRSFSEFGTYVHHIKAAIPRGIYALPINLSTINQFFGKRFTPVEARTFVETLGDKSIREPQNFEEQALKFIGKELYEAFFYGYSKKQWGCEPRELSAAILKRLPVRFNYSDDYYGDRYQGIPVDGYTAIIERILAHDSLEVRLSTEWDAAMAGEFEHVIFTGPLDQFYGYRFGRLGYRTVFWDHKQERGDYQGCAQINYPDMSQPFTRVIEHKHFTPWENHEETIVSNEFSKETGEGDVPYYPKRLATDKALLAQYLRLAEQETKVSFLGRLATYRYLDMHHIIGEALDFAPRLAKAIRNGQPRPVFPEATLL
jgi:UDP-galactopyranose mutase